MRVLGFEGELVDKAYQFTIEGGAEEARMFAEVEQVEETDEEEVEQVEETDEEGEMDEEELEYEEE